MSLSLLVLLKDAHDLLFEVHDFLPFMLGQISLLYFSKLKQIYLVHIWSLEWSKRLAGTYYSFSFKHAQFLVELVVVTFLIVNPILFFAFFNHCKCILKFLAFTCSKTYIFGDGFFYTGRYSC